MGCGWVTLKGDDLLIRVSYKCYPASPARQIFKRTWRQKILMRNYDNQLLVRFSCVHALARFARCWSSTPRLGAGRVEHFSFHFVWLRFISFNFYYFENDSLLLVLNSEKLLSHRFQFLKIILKYVYTPGSVDIGKLNTLSSIYFCWGMMTRIANEGSIYRTTLLRNLHENLSRSFNRHLLPMV